MNEAWSIRGLVPRVAFVLALGAPAVLPAQQQQIPLFTWTGRVAGRVDITVRRASASALTLNGERAAGTLSVQNALPAGVGTIRVSTSTSAANAQVVQQPSASNDYTAIVRVVSVPLGSREVQVSAVWTGDAGAYSDSRGTYDNRGTSDNRGTYDDRARRRDRDDDEDRAGRREHDEDDERVRGRDDDDEDHARAGRRDDDDDDRYEHRKGNRNGNNGVRNRGRGRGRGRGNTGYGSQQEGVLHWSGNVDGEIRLRWDGQQAVTRTISGKAPTGVASNVAGSVPSNGVGTVAVTVNQGRGQVIVAQQPSARNNYTAVVRVIDPTRGYGHYDFDVTWR